MGSSGSGAVNPAQTLPGAGGLSEYNWAMIVRRLRLSMREGEIIRCIGARYDSNYRISADDLDFLAARVRDLLDHTDTICTAALEQLTP